MVAYSFHKRFAPRIADGSKTHTIRAARTRHARPGEMVQLFTGMRTRNCLKIIPDPLCVRVEAVGLWFDDDGAIREARIDADPVEDLDAFAVSDGFESLADMAGFWTTTHGQFRRFDGVLIQWVPVYRSDIQ